MNYFFVMGIEIYRFYFLEKSKQKQINPPALLKEYGIDKSSSMYCIWIEKARGVSAPRAVQTYILIKKQFISLLNHYKYYLHPYNCAS